MANLTQNSWNNGSKPSNPILNFSYFPSDGVNSMDVNNVKTKTEANLAGLDYSFSIAGKPSLGLDKSSTINQATAGAEIGESIYASFSNGHHSMFETAANQVKHEIATNGSYDIPTVLVSYEGMTADAYGHAEETKENMRYLAEQGIPYVFVSGQGKSAAVEAGYQNQYAESGYYIGEYLRAGGTVYVTDVNGAVHADNEKGYMQCELDNNFIGALAGNGSLQENSDTYKGIYKCQVDPNTGKLVITEIPKDEFIDAVRKDSYEAAGKNPDNNTANNSDASKDEANKQTNTSDDSSNNDAEKMGASGASGNNEANGASPSVTELYANNSTLSDFANNYVSPDSTHKTLASDLVHVNNSMDNLESLMAPSKTRQVSQSGIIGTMDAAQSHYCNITNSVLGTLGDEINAVRSIAEAVYQMDGAASAIAQDSLSDGLNSFMSGVQYSQADIDTINKFNNTLGTEIANTLNKTNYDSFQPFGDVSTIGSTSINGLNSSLANAFLTLGNENMNAKQMQSVLDDFSASIGDNNILSGELWDSVKNNVDVYSDLMELRQNTSEFMMETLQIAYEMVRETIEPDASIDASILPELESDLTEVNQNIESLTQQIEQMRASQHEECSYDENNEPYNCKLVPSNEEIAEVQSTLNDYEAQREELEYEIERINNYIEAVTKAQKLINDAINQIDETYGRAAESLQNNGKLPDDIGIDMSAYEIGEYGELLESFRGRQTLALPSSDPQANIAEYLYNLGQYSSNPDIGFELWLSQNKYNLNSFEASELRQKYGYDADQALEAFIAVCIAESDKTKDDTLGVASVALNRCEVPNWAEYYKNGSNPFDQMFAKGGSQYQTITDDSPYNSNIKRYEAFMPSVVGMDKVNEVLGQYGTDYNTLKGTVMDAVTGGVRNNFYTGFRANGYQGWSDVHISPGGNKYQYEGYGNRDQAYVQNLKSQMSTETIPSTSGGNNLTLLVSKGASMDPGMYGNDGQATSTPQITTLEHHGPINQNNNTQAVNLSTPKTYNNYPSSSNGYSAPSTPDYGSLYDGGDSGLGFTSLKSISKRKPYKPIVLGEYMTEPLTEFPTDVNGLLRVEYSDLTTKAGSESTWV